MSCFAELMLAIRFLAHNKARDDVCVSVTRTICAIEAHHDFPSTALADSARSALFRTVLAVLAVFACMTRIGTRAGRGKKTFRPSKCGEHSDQGQKESREGPFINHRAFSSDAVSCTSDPD
jgi:hypothetical protein